jgi:alcohol dehydrogenase
MLLKSCCSGTLAVEKITMHRFDFDQIEKAYDVFKHAAVEKATKIIIDY